MNPWYNVGEHIAESQYQQPLVHGDAVRRESWRIHCNHYVILAYIGFPRTNLQMEPVSVRYALRHGKLYDVRSKFPELWVQVGRREFLHPHLRWVFRIVDVAVIGVAAGYQHLAVREEDGGRMIHARNVACGQLPESVPTFGVCHI